VDEQRKRISLSMKKTPGEKSADQKDTAAPSSPSQVKHKIEPGRPMQRQEKKKVKEAPKPFNNPFAEAFRKK